MIPYLPVDPDGSPPHVEKVAEQTRQDWSLGDEPIPHVVREIERHGIPVARLTIGHRLVDAFSVPFEQGTNTTAQ